MFKLTFLGHQGWLISTATTNLLIDPLLTEGFGHGGLLGALYPPRILDLAGFPPIDAVIFTHEHDDHFDIPSINRLDRAIPIYLSIRSSIAARSFLAELGFEVRPLEPDAELAIGDLRYQTFVADHRSSSQGDEWDVFPFFVHDTNGHGSLLSSVDVSTLPSSLPVRPAVWAHAHNSTRTDFQRLGAVIETPSDAPLLAAAVLRRFAQLEACGGSPSAALICGQGWSFPDERAWINQEAFPVTAEQLRDTLAAASPHTKVAVPNPGTTLEFTKGRLLDIHDRQAFIGSQPRERWPDRIFIPATERPRDYAPATTQFDINLDELLTELNDFASYLYATPLFRSLYSLPSTIRGYQSAVCFALHLNQSPDRLILRYDPTACRFTQTESESPESTFASGIECHATDLLALFQGTIAPSALCYAGRLRVWNHAPQQLRFSPHDLWTFAHPLRRPARALKLYQTLFSADHPNPTKIRSRNSNE